MPLTESPSWNKRQALILIAALAALVYVGIGFAVDATRIGAAIGQLGWTGCWLVLALSGVNYLLRFYRWNKFIAHMSHKLPTGRHMLYYLSGFAFTVSPAKAGEALRSVYLRGYGVSYSESVAALFVERSLDLLAMVVLACLVVADRPAYLPLVAGVLVVLIVALTVVSRGWLPDLVDRLGDRLRQLRLVKLLASVSQLLRSSRALTQPPLLALGTIVALISWGAEGLGFYMICRGLLLDVAPVTAVGIYALAVLAGSAAFFLPAGIGGMEVAMTALLVAQGAPLRAAVIATLLCRIATLWFAVLIGIAAAAIIELKPRVARLRPSP